MKRYSSGSALIEVIVAVGLFALFSVSFVRLSLTAYDTPAQGRQQLQATLFAEEGMEALRSIGRNNFSLLINGTHGLTSQTGAYALSGTGNIDGRYTRALLIEDVYRDENDNIIATGGTVDNLAKRLTSTVTWNVTDNRPTSLTLWSIITDWARQLTTWTIDLFAELNTGSIGGTRVLNNADGEVQLKAVGSLLDPSLYFSIDTDRFADITALHHDSIQDRLYVTLNNDAQAAEVMVFDTSNLSSGVLSMSGSVDIGDDAVQIATDERYGYVLNNSTSEITVFDTVTFTAVSAWDIPSTSDPVDAALDTTNNILYVATLNSSDEELYAIDTSTPTSGTIAINDQGEIGQDTSALALYQDSYLFIGTYGATSELLIAPTSNLASITTCDLPGSAAVVDIDIVGNRLFITQANTITEYTINPVSPTNCTPTTVGSATIAETITDTYIDPDTNTAFLATDTSGYAVVDLSSFANTTFSLGFGCDATIFIYAYTIQGCRDNTNTLNVLQGGVGGWQSLSAVGNANLPGSVTAHSTVEVGGYLYMGTSTNSGGAEFFIFDVSTSVGNNMTAVGSVEIGADVNDIYVSGNTAYLATTDNNRELIVVNVTTKSSPSISGSFDAQRTQDGLSVFAVGTTVYLGTQNNNGNSGGNPRPELYILNALVPAVIVQLGGYNVGADANDIWVNGSTAFVTTSASSQELVALNVTVPALPTLLGSYNASGNDPGIELLYQNNIFFMLTNSNVYTINITNPASLSALGSIAVANPTSFAYNQDQNLLFVGTTDTAAEVSVLNVGDITNMSSLYTLNLSGNSAVYSLDATASYVFAGTNNASTELVVIGPGASSAELAHKGTYTSPIFDTGIDSAFLLDIAWADSGSSSTVLRVRSGNSIQDILSARFVGTDGTTAAVYTTKAGESITEDILSNGQRFIQWKAYFSGSGAQSPILEDVTITYQ